MDETNPIIDAEIAEIKAMIDRVLANCDRIIEKLGGDDE